MGLFWLVCGMLRVRVRPDCHQNRHQSRPDERFPEGLETGRVWGTWNEEMLPVRSETKVGGIEVSENYCSRHLGE